MRDIGNSNVFMQYMARSQTGQLFALCSVGRKTEIFCPVAFPFWLVPSLLTLDYMEYIKKKKKEENTSLEINILVQICSFFFLQEVNDSVYFQCPPA